jgi:hypothetical protein
MHGEKDLAKRPMDSFLKGSVASLVTAGQAAINREGNLCFAL